METNTDDSTLIKKTKQGLAKMLSYQGSRKRPAHGGKRQHKIGVIKAGYFGLR